MVAKSVSGKPFGIIAALIWFGEVFRPLSFVLPKVLRSPVRRVLAEVSLPPGLVAADAVDGCG